MPWYYAGADAQPIGPLSLEELRALHASGAIAPETYIIERTGQPGDPTAWQRYRDVFTPRPTFPPLPSAPPLPPPPPVAPPAAAATHPLFPSAGVERPPHLPYSYTVSPPGPTDTRPVNKWCARGFWFGLASLILILPSCGLATILALPALFMSIIGLIQVGGRREQSGRGRAAAGLLFSCVALLLALIILTAGLRFSMSKQEQTTTEQSTNDSE